MTELAPYLDDYDTAVAGGNREAIVAAAQAVVDVINAHLPADLMIGGKGVAGNPDTELQSLWATVIDRIKRLMRDVVKFNQPILVPPALP